MIRTMFLVIAALTVAVATVPSRASAAELTVFTDADASVRVICRNDRSEADCLTPLGTSRNDPGFDDYQYVYVRDQNSSQSGYWHFDLSGIPAGTTVISAKFQLDTQTNSWGDTAVNVVAITDPDKDWDLNALPESEINGQNAPLVDVDAFPWTGDPGADGQQRFNGPLPFLEEGDTPADAARVLIPFPDFALIEDEDPFTVDAGNAYGGHTNNLSAGAGGSSSSITNAWPVKNAIDLDITDLVNWKLGNNPAYSDFEPKDAELTFMVRTEVAGTNGMVRFISRESIDNTNITLDPDGLPALLPGRIVVTIDVVTIDVVIEPGDFNGNLVLDLPDVNMLNAEINAGTNDGAFDLNGDAMVDTEDQRIWVKELKRTWFGDADLNGLFNSADIVSVLGIGKFDTDEDAGWEEGDWTGDRRFNSADVIKALADGGFDQGPVVATAAVPEPSSLVILTILSLGLMLYRRS